MNRRTTISALLALAGLAAAGYFFMSSWRAPHPERLGFVAPLTYVEFA